MAFMAQLKSGHGSLDLGDFQLFEGIARQVEATEKRSQEALLDVLRGQDAVRLIETPDPEAPAAKK